MALRTKNKIHLTSEGRVLRDLRNARRLSMRRAGELFGRSDSYISQIENGRIRPPQGEDLDRLLEIYGVSNQERFFHRVRNFKEKFTLKDEVIELIQKMNNDESKVILKIAKALVA